MRHDRLLILGGVLAAAMIAVGCGSSSSPTPDGAAGKGGSGGAGGKGSGGTMDAGVDHGPTTDAGPDISGAGGSTADAHGDLAPGDAPADMAMDTPVDTGSHDAGPCVTDFGAGNPVQFAFDKGVNEGWKTFATNNSNLTGLTTSLGASFTEGHSCPGSVILGLNFTAYGQQGAIEFYYGSSPTSNPPSKNWTGFKALHGWLKVETDTLSELNGVNFYMKSGNQMYYQAAFVAGANLGDWHEFVIDLTRPPNAAMFSGVMINDVQQIGFEAYLNAAPATGAPTTPSQVLLLVDDIWLEAAAQSDAGTIDAGDAGGQ